MKKKWDITLYEGVLPDWMTTVLWELYARRILQLIMPDVYGGLDKRGKPDLIDVSASHGVEVTWSREKDAFKAESLYAKLQYCQTETEKRKSIEEIEDTGACYVEGTLILPAAKDGISQIMLAYERKLKKLNAGQYDKVKTCDLYIQSDDLIDSDGAREALESFIGKAVEYDRGFGRVIVSTPGMNYVFDLRCRTVKSFPLDFQKQCEIADAAREEVLMLYGYIDGEADCQLGIKGER